MSVGIQELSLDEVLQLQAQTPERGKYKRVATEFANANSIGQDVTGAFDTTKTTPDSIKQGFKKAIADSNGDLANVAVVEKDGRIMLYRLDHATMVAENDE
jgi:hypothetical protein